MSATLDTLLAMDERLAAHGKPRVFAPGSFWREQAMAFYGHSTASEWWAQVGRGGAKSTVIYRIAENETVFGDWDIPNGERHWATLKSKSKEEAGKALGIIASDLDALGVRHTVAGDCIELTELPRGIRITAASVGGTSGWRSYFDANDEIAKWPRDGASAVDVREVVASGRAMTVTHAKRRPKRLYFSTPFGMEGPHYENVQEGTTAAQLVTVAASWIANPTVITEADTRALERDSRIWSREYAAIPQAGALAAFDPAHIERAMGLGIEDLYLECAPILLLDPTAGQSDVYTYAVARWRVAPELARWVTRRVWVPGADWVDVPENDAAGKRIPNPEWQEQLGSKLEFMCVAGIENAARRGLTSDHIVKHIVGVARQYGACAVHSDQFERFALASAIGKYGLPFFAHSWTAPLKERAVERVRQWLRDGALSLPKFDRLQKELLSFEERIAPSGALTFRGRQGGHDDHAMLVMLAALVDIEGQMPGSPLTASRAAPFPSWLVA